MHRSLIVIFVIVFLVGVLWIRGYLKSTRNMIISSLTISIVVIILGLHLNSRAVSDIERISQGEFLEIESIELNEDSSLLFRMAHFLRDIWKLLKQQ